MTGTKAGFGRLADMIERGELHLLNLLRAMKAVGARSVKKSPNKLG